MSTIYLFQQASYGTPDKTSDYINEKLRLRNEEFELVDRFKHPRLRFNGHRVLVTVYIEEMGIRTIRTANFMVTLG